MATAMDQRESEQRTSEFALATLMDVFVLYRRMMAWIFSIIAGLGIAYAVLSPPVYQADLMVQVEQSNLASSARSPFGDLAAMFDVKSSAENEIQVIASRAVLAKAVDELHLDIEARPVRVPVVGNAIARLNIFGRDNKADIKVNQFDVPGAHEGARYTVTDLGGGHYRLLGPGIDKSDVASVGAPCVFGSEDGPVTLDIASLTGQPGSRFSVVRQSRIHAIDALQKSLSVSREGRDTSDMLRVRLRGSDPHLIVDTLNAIAHYYVAQNAAQKANDAAHSRAVLESEVPEMREKLELAEAEFTALRSKLHSIDTDDEAKTLVAQTAAIDAQMTQLMQSRSDQVSRFNANYPSVIAIDQQLAILRAKRDQFAKRINDLPAEQRKLVTAERELRVKRDLYLAQLSNIAQLNLIRAGRDSTVRMIDMAAVPDRPMTMRRFVTAAIAIALGAFLAAIAAYVRDILFAGISYARDVEIKTGLRVAAAVPRAAQPGLHVPRFLRATQSSPIMLAVKDPNDPAIETLRSLRASLQFSMLSEGANNIVMFTSPSPLLGKSFISSNFAAVLAAADKRVLLIDADLRRASLSRGFGHGKCGGFFEVLNGTLKADAAIVSTEQPHLDFLPAGSGRRNAADLLTGAPVQDIMRQLAASYDVVVLDTAPLMSVPDALMLAPLARGNIFVLARSGVTKPEELSETARRLAQVGERIAGVVLNCIDPRAGRFRLGVRYESYRYVSDTKNSGHVLPDPRNKGEYVKT